MKQKRIAILYICTGQYRELWPAFYNTAKKYLLPEHNKTFFVWSDKKLQIQGDDVKLTYIPWKPYPHALINRYSHFLMRKNDLLQYDYCFFFNANLEFRDYIHDEILPINQPFVAVNNITHHLLNLEDRVDNIKQNYWSDCPASPAYIPMSFWEQNPTYCWLMGGFNGGKAKEWVEMCEQIDEWVNYNQNHNLILKWHDEPFMNKYMYDHGVLTLDPTIYLNWYTFAKYDPNCKTVLKRKNQVLSGNYRIQKDSIRSLNDRLHNLQT